MSKRHNIEYIRQGFEDKGCILKSTKYKNTRTRLDYICPNGHEHSISWYRFQRGGGCPYCYGNVRKTIEYIREQFEKRNCILKSKKYVNGSTKLDYVCPNGHEHSIRWDNFKQGQGCPFCVGLAKPTIEYITEYLSDKGWLLKSTEYVNAHTKLNCVCPNGHEHSIRWNDFQQGYGCPICHVDKLTIDMLGEGNRNWKGGVSKDSYCQIWRDNDYMRDIFERDNYTCQNPYCFHTCPNDLVRHHIEYDKEKCSPKDIITLCRVCHGYSGANRDWHKLYFQTLMNKKYGYTYE